MFVLTCPSCEAEVRCRYARGGAVASCPKCRVAYRLNAHTMREEAERADLFAPWRASGKAATAQRPDASPAAGSASACVKEDTAALEELERAVTVQGRRRRATGRGRGGRLAIMLGFNVAAASFVVAWVVLVLRWTAGIGPVPANASADSPQSATPATQPSSPTAVESPSGGASAPDGSAIASEVTGAPLPRVRFTH